MRVPVIKVTAHFSWLHRMAILIYGEREGAGWPCRQVGCVACWKVV